jgi:hypothetical protein
LCSESSTRPNSSCNSNSRRLWRIFILTLLGTCSVLLLSWIVLNYFIRGLKFDRFFMHDDFSMVTSCISTCYSSK